MFKLVLILLLFYFLSLFSLTSCNSTQNNRPIIGVIAQPYNVSSPNITFIPSSYVRFLEAAGARVVPIPYDLPKQELKKLFKSLNGLLFTGGDTVLWDIEKNTYTNFSSAGKYLIELAIIANKKGDYFPIWGTCLGYELLLITIANGYVLETFDSTNHRTQLAYFKNLTKNSKMFKKLTPKLKKNSEKKDLMFFFHHYGISVEGLQNNSALSSFFKITSTAKSKDGKTFVASIEGKRFPFYGVQYHPEKTLAEWTKMLDLDHSEDAIEYSLYLSKFYVSETRKNFHFFKNNQTEEKSLISNYCPVKQEGKTFSDAYFFKSNNIEQTFE